MWIEGIDVLVTLLSLSLGLFSLWLSWSVGREVWEEQRNRKRPKARNNEPLRESTRAA